MPTMMRDATISFPMLGDWSIDPSASFTLFGHTFYWYGAIIAVGFILAMLYCARHCRRCGIKPDTLYDFLIWMIPLAIIGARLYYVIFQWSDYREHPLNAFKIWEGGLAIYGGVIAGILTGIVCAAAQYFLSVAYSYAPSTKISVYLYAQNLFAFLIGIVFFHELPDWIAIAGGCLLIAAGILNFISGREAQRRLSDDT